MKTSATKPALDEVRERLRLINDPELGCNIVDLGLVYKIVLFEHRVSVEMTLTSPGCPMGEILLTATQSTLCDIPGIERAEVNLVWDPPWSVARMSAEARNQLGVPADL